MASLNALADKYSRQFCLQKSEVLYAFRENGVPETEDEQIAVLLHHHGRELAAKKAQYAGLRSALNRKMQENQNLAQENQNLSQRITDIERTMAMMQAELMAIRSSQNSQRNYSTQQLRIGDNM